MRFLEVFFSLVCLLGMGVVAGAYPDLAGQVLGLLALLYAVHLAYVVSDDARMYRDMLRRAWDYAEWQSTVVIDPLWAALRRYGGDDAVAEVADELQAARRRAAEAN